MKRIISASLATMLLMLANPSIVLPRTVGLWTGQVEHVSSTNIKVYGWKQHKTESFLLMPHFKNVFAKDGKTTYQMASIKPGMIVKVYYDQKLLGTRHADRILVIGGNDLAVMNVKS